MYGHRLWRPLKNVKKKLLTVYLPQNVLKEPGTGANRRNRPTEKAKAEAQVIIEQANKQRNQMIEEAKAEAEAERTKIVAQAQAEIDAERKRAREELRKQVAMLAVAGAEKIIERSVDEAANSDIVDKLVAEL